MLSKKMQNEAKKISKEAVRVLKISGAGKDSKDTYERAKSTLAMLDIAIRMLISEFENSKVSINKIKKLSPNY